MHLDVGTLETLRSETMNSLDLVHAEGPEAFNALTRLAARLFDVPVSLISFIEDDLGQQFFASQYGLEEPLKSQAKIPLTHSFCKLVKNRNAPLIVNDARKAPLVSKNKAIADFGLIAYLGMPIHLPDGTTVGSVCVFDVKPRVWSEDEIQMLEDISRCVDAEIKSRSAAAENQKYLAKTQRYNAMRESISRAFMMPDLTIEARFEEMLQASCRALNMKAGQITKIEPGSIAPLFTFCGSEAVKDAMAATNLSSLATMVTQECCHLTFQDLRAQRNQISAPLTQRATGCYVGTPLILNGILYGVVEFYDDAPRPNGWSAEELSILTMVSMYATAHLGVFGQINVLRNSERALLTYISQYKSSTRDEPRARA